MSWFYVNAGQQAGPVDDAQLDALLAAGQINSETLVWREGMASWQPHREARTAGSSAGPPPVSAGAPPGPSANETVCAECGRILPIDSTIQYGTVRVCAACKPVLMQKLAEGAKIGDAALTYAGFWIRVGAKLLDGLIIGFPFIIALGYILYRRAADSQATEFLGVQFALQGAMILVSWSYNIFFLGKYGATLGKMACGLRVVTAEGARFGYARATGRVFAEMLSGLICHLGYIMVAFDSEKRALHDRICNTRVITRK